jgi:hypothetical protein
MAIHTTCSLSGPHEEVQCHAAGRKLPFELHPTRFDDLGAVLVLAIRFLATDAQPCATALRRAACSGRARSLCANMRYACGLLHSTRGRWGGQGVRR